jgi:hypothetical protein
MNVFSLVCDRLWLFWFRSICGKDCFLFSDLMETDNLMEGLVGSQTAPISARCRQHSSPFLPAFSHRFTRKLNISHIGMNKSPKSLKSIAASVQPLETSKLGRLNNTLPSKGYAQAMS